MKLLFPYQNLKIIKPNLYRIGITNILKNKLKRKYERDNRFELEIKKEHTQLFYDSIVCNIYNHHICSSYVILTPYSGVIERRNYELIRKPELILNNNEEDNWLFDIETNFNYNYFTFA